MSFELNSFYPHRRTQEFNKKPGFLKKPGFFLPTKRGLKNYRVEVAGILHFSRNPLNQTTG
ncbi:MAG: hypothetical protein EAZ90_21940 [Oscillatoriales cyanobacterium]|nr:MAG: hypothetical protein EAZ94_25755 [Oscillatoriales cyanobacterium]TAE18979.1 MAG: hypothetical protein EAZ93_28305 [Oscillatoriales cyanobacterium]TAE39766.1 MAG: hypothetical protein EAZ90_21940 [Oscillatoriales cyanobacterium]TAE65528.1 MAG: hypothetical protein EAZ86_24530 [Oscillatoriales cyanobacterium]TAF84431.1 MAG: hypothetical protein EAZ49_29670 [Oscillatoriales cyanobacterium]